MSKKTTKPTVPITRDQNTIPPARRKLTTLADMQAVFEKSITIQFTFDGAEYEIEAKRLSPAESHKLEEMLITAAPPLIKGKTADDDRFDVANPDYVRKKTLLSIQARAMGIYWSVPAIRRDFDAKQVAATGSAANPPEVNAVTDFVQKLFNDQVLELIWQSVRDGGVQKLELVNFSSASAFRES